MSQDKSAKVTLHCLDAEQLREWSGAVSSRIAALTNAAMAAYNEGQGEHSHEKVLEVCNRASNALTEAFSRDVLYINPLSTAAGCVDGLGA